MKVLHITILDKFIPPFITFVNENFNPNDHLFIIIGAPRSEYGMDLNIENVFWLDSKSKMLELIKYLYEANKIIVHGLWDERIVRLLYLKPRLLEKVYWVMWGGDFYLPEEHSDIKRFVIKNIKNVITYTDGDVDYIKKYYKANPKHHKCLMYLSGIFDESKYKACQKIEKDEIWVLAGNSANNTNRHEFVFESVKKSGLENLKVIVPLSYDGNVEYKNKILNIGEKMFGDKFYPLLDFISYNEYLNMLYNIDIALFAHKIQQGMGNLIQLLGLGKKVYLNPESSLWNLFQDLGIKVYDINGDIDLITNSEELENNKRIVKEVFSLKSLKTQLKRVFDE